MDKRKIKELIIFATIFVAYNTLVFVLPFKKNAIFAISYIFALISIFGFAASYMVAFVKTNSLKDMFLSFPIFRIGVFHMIAQVCSSAIYMLLGTFFKFPVWGAVLSGVIFLSIALIKALTLDIARERIAEVAIKEEQDTAFIKLFQIDLKTLANRTKDENIKTKLLKLVEAVRYSDPVSVDPVRELENNMTNLFEKIKAGTEDLEAKIDELTTLLTERNAKCKVMKK